ncbi:transposase family protein [Trichormus azollae]|uniref:transposase family protein n=1 Tax=Trichormus azollae TaxID=1164 RepID=UPI00325D7845
MPFFSNYHRRRTYYHSLRKAKKTELSKTEEEENKELSSRRIFVEYLICRVKIFRVASDRFRLARHPYSQVIETVCG